MIQVRGDAPDPLDPRDEERHVSARQTLGPLSRRRVELGLWRLAADRFVGPDPSEAIEALRDLQTDIAYYSATVGTKTERETFSVLVRDLVARGRAAGIIVVAATQRPSSDIIPTTLRDLFGYRWAFLCTTDAALRARGEAARAARQASSTPRSVPLPRLR